MSTHVGTVTSSLEVQPELEDGQAGTAAEGAPAPEELERMQAVRARLERDAQRTRARGFDD